MLYSWSEKVRILRWLIIVRPIIDQPMTAQWRPQWRLAVVSQWRPFLAVIFNRSSGWRSGEHHLPIRSHSDQKDTQSKQNEIQTQVIISCVDEQKNIYTIHNIILQIFENSVAKQIIFAERNMNFCFFLFLFAYFVFQTWTKNQLTYQQWTAINHSYFCRKTAMIFAGNISHTNDVKPHGVWDVLSTSIRVSRDVTSLRHSVFQRSTFGWNNIRSSCVLYLYKN